MMYCHDCMLRIVCPADGHLTFAALLPLLWLGRCPQAALHTQACGALKPPALHTGMWCAAHRGMWCLETALHTGMWCAAHRHVVP